MCRPEGLLLSYSAAEMVAGDYRDTPAPLHSHHPANTSVDGCIIAKDYNTDTDKLSHRLTPSVTPYTTAIMDKHAHYDSRLRAIYLEAAIYLANTDHSVGTRSAEWTSAVNVCLVRLCEFLIYTSGLCSDVEHTITI